PAAGMAKAKGRPRVRDRYWRCGRRVAARAESVCRSHPASLALDSIYANLVGILCQILMHEGIIRNQIADGIDYSYATLKQTRKRLSKGRLRTSNQPTGILWIFHRPMCLKKADPGADRNSAAG